MRIEHRIVDYATFSASINKSKRSKLVGLVHEVKLRERVAEHMIQVMPLSGWREFKNPAKDNPFRFRWKRNFFILCKLILCKLILTNTDGSTILYLSKRIKTKRRDRNDMARYQLHGICGIAQ